MKKTILPLTLILVYVFLLSNCKTHNHAIPKLNPGVDAFTIENSVVTYEASKADPTKVGHQFWFADKSFLGDGRTLKMSVVAPHKSTHAPHTHEEDEFFFVLEGTAKFHLNGKTTTRGPYTSFYCPANSYHGISNIGDTELKYLVIKRYNL